MRGVVFTLVAVGTIAGCRPTSMGAPPNPARDNPTDDQGAPTTPPIESTPGHVAPSAREAGGSTGSFACGQARCTTGQQFCCSYPSSARCVARPAEMPNGREVGGFPWSAEVVAAISACGSTGQPNWDELREVHYCRTSDDCAGTSVCIADHQVYWEMPDFLYCVPREQAPAFAEVCEEDSQCKTAGRICLRGQCRRASRQVHCGSDMAPCGPRQFCWAPGMGGDLNAGSCNEPNLETDGLHSRHECDDPSDCLPGQYCCSGFTNRCDFACGGGDTPAPLCADGTMCDDFERCDACGAKAN